MAFLYKKVKSTLGLILKSIKEFDSEIVGIVMTSSDRIEKAKERFKKLHFSRKQYMELFKSISSATASRDLKEGIDLGQLFSEGLRNQTKYKFKK